MAFLYQEVHVPVFFGKLAQAGIQPSSPEEAERLLEAGHRLANLRQVNQTKQASNSPILQACSELDSALSQLGVGESHMTDAQVKQAAAQVLKRPEIASAVEVLQKAMAVAA